MKSFAAGTETYAKLYPEKSSDGVIYSPHARSRFDLMYDQQADTDNHHYLGRYIQQKTA